MDRGVNAVGSPAVAQALHLRKTGEYLDNVVPTVVLKW